jgi:hypothetical protein
VYKADEQNKEILALAASLLGTDSSQVLMKDVTRLYLWSKKHRIFWGLTSVDRRSVVIVLGPNNAPLVTTSKSGLSLLSLILIEERGSLPDGLSPYDFAEAIRQLTVSPEGLMGSPDLLKRKSPPFDAWFPSRTGSRNELEEIFRLQCVAPILHSDSNSRKWLLEFSYFNQRGGVERWHVEGDNSMIRSAEKKMAAADGTFNWPFE